MKDGQRWTQGRELRQIVMGIGVGPQWDRQERVCVCLCVRSHVCRPPLSIMKANQLGWQRSVLQEESQSTEPNEPGLEIREGQRKKERQREESKSNELIGFQLRKKVLKGKR